MSAVNRIDLNRVQPSIQEQQQVEQVRAKRIEAYDAAESFVRAGAPTLVSVADVQAALPEEQRAGIERLFAGMSPTQQAAFQAQAAELSGQLLAVSGQANAEAQIVSILSNAMPNVYEITGAPPSGEDLTLNTLLCSYYGVEADLAGFAYKVQHNNDMKAALREEATSLRDQLSNWPEGEVRTITYRVIEKQADGSYKVVEKTENLSKEDAKNLLSKIEEQLNTLADVSQMDNMKLQQTMEKQQELLQTMSSIMKAVHDAAKGIINNIK